VHDSPLARRSPTRWRTRLSGIVLTTLMLPLGVPGAALAQSTDGLEKIDPEVLAEVAGGEETTFWVTVAGDADLSGAQRLADEARPAFVYQTKTAHAEHAQRSLRELLERRDVAYTSFWITNEIQVTADERVLREIAARDDVVAITPDEPLPLPETEPGTPEATVNAVEWNIDRINAPQVWSEYGTRGDGIVVAQIDTGVDYTHPALFRSYRGNTPTGVVHDYNWFGPLGICKPVAPCDASEHGTHVMGIIAGLDGDNQIGVAPNVRWIAAQGCDGEMCHRDALLAAGQWIIAPTDLNGENPRPDLAPDIVNNSWGGGAGSDPEWYLEVVEAWVAAGIFPANSNGNNGPDCGTATIPGAYAVNYSTASFDINNVIEWRSSRGPGLNGEIKPNIAAPGVNIRSARPGGGYRTTSGSSMASPHTAGTVALMWSAVPSLRGDVAATRQLLDDGAIDVNDTSCGGTADDNNVWGEGRLDAYASVSAAAAGQVVGTLQGVVDSNGTPIPDATVTVTGPMTRTVTTASDGSYLFPRLLQGSYTLTVSHFEYTTYTGTVNVTPSGAVQNVSLTLLPTATVTGTVTNSDGPVSGSTVSVVGTSVSTTTDASGTYQLTLPVREHYLTATAPSEDRCHRATTTQVVMTGDTTHNIQLARRVYDAGYTCTGPVSDYLSGTTPVDLTDTENVEVPLPFPVPFYGTTYTSLWVTPYGLACFTGPFETFAPTVNRPLPHSFSPDGCVFPFWDGIQVDSQAGVYTATIGSGASQVFVVEWRDVAISVDTTQRLSFSVIIQQDGTITFRYAGIETGDRENGSSATIGLESANGVDAFLYSYNSPVVKDDTFGVTFHPPA